jgi:hypothetical protein
MNWNIFKRSPDNPVRPEPQHHVEEKMPVIDNQISAESAEEQPGKRDSPPEIPEHVFVEYAKPNRKVNMEPQNEEPEVNNLKKLYDHLERNLEKQGYEDALVNPDTSYLEEHLQYIATELELLLSKVKIYYTSHLKSVAFHIDTRKRKGLIETVEELNAHKSTIEDEIRIVNVIEEDAKKRNGLTQNLFVSYRKGFHNGFAAITYNTILSKRK